MRQERKMETEVERLQRHKNITTDVLYECGIHNVAIHPRLAGVLPFMQGSNTVGKTYSKHMRNTPFTKRTRASGKVVFKQVRPMHIFIGLIKRRVKGVYKTLLGRTSIHTNTIQVIYPQ